MSMQRMIRNAAVFVLAMSVTALSAFASGQPEQTATAGPVAFTVFVPEANIPAETNRTTQWLEERFDVDITWTSSPWGEYHNSLVTRLAAGDIPDWFTVQGSTRHPIYDELVADEIVVNLEDHLSRYANLYRYVNDEHPEIRTLFGEPADDGLYAIAPFFGYQRHGLFYRKDIADSLGLSTPSTWDEFRTFLQAMVDADVENTDPFGLSVFTRALLDNSIPAFTGEAAGWYIRDGQWIHQAFDPGFRQWVAYWQQMYDDGLLDPEWHLLRTADVVSKFASGRIVASLNHINTGNWDLFEDPLLSARPSAEMALLLPYPEGPAGRYWVRNDGYFMAYSLSAQSSPAVRDRMLDIWDWNHTEEGQNVSTFGVEGVHWTLQNGQVSRNLPESRLDSIALGDGEHWPMYLGANFSLREQIEIEPIRQNSQALAQYGVSQSAYRITVPLADRTEWDGLITRFNETNTEWLLRFLTGEADVGTDYDAYLEALRENGYDGIVSFYERFGEVLDL